MARPLPLWALLASSLGYYFHAEVYLFKDMLVPVLAMMMPALARGISFLFNLPAGLLVSKKQNA